ncbi:MAG TPA: nuclear transport factor 2 family protein [Pyrinomonadaceae bacterium]|nr:nuclear transport factor 2 family protein [Pyrinomonadaceae bacterium]
MQSDAAVKNVKQDDEEAIREMVDTWIEASKRGDLATLLNLLADDVLFITPGKEPFGKQEFAANNPSGSMKDIKMEAAIDIKEISVAGAWAWMRSFLRVSFTPAEGDATKLAGHILTILQKNSDGQWVIKRDANFVAPSP